MAAVLHHLKARLLAQEIRERPVLRHRCQCSAGPVARGEKPFQLVVGRPHARAHLRNHGQIYWQPVVEKGSVKPFETDARRKRTGVVITQNDRVHFVR